MQVALVLTLLFAMPANAGKSHFRAQLGQPGAFGGPFPTSNPVSGPDYFFSLFVTPPTLGQQCTGAALVSDQGDSITTVRASSAYCTKGDGTMVLLADDQPRVQTIGVVQEGPGRNLTTKAEKLGHAAWTYTQLSGTASYAGDTSVTTPWGALIMGDLVETGTGGYAYQAATVSSSTGPFVAAAYGRASSGTHSSSVGLEAAETIGTCTCYREDGASCTTAIVNSDFTCVATSTFDATTVTRLVAVATTNVATTTVYGEVFVADNITKPGGTKHHLWSGVTVEAGSNFATSYIPTDGTSVARALDDIHFDPPHSLTTAGCAAVTAKFARRYVNNAMVMAGGGFSLFPYNAGSDNLQLADDTNFNTNHVVGETAGRTIAIRSQWGGSASRLDADGVPGTPGTFDGTMNASTIWLGSLQAGAYYLFGELGGIKLGTSATGCAQ